MYKNLVELQNFFFSLLFLKRHNKANHIQKSCEGRQTSALAKDPLSYLNQLK